MSGGGSAMAESDFWEDRFQINGSLVWDIELSVPRPSWHHVLKSEAFGRKMSGFSFSLE
jgi:hypothetical protein